MIEKDGDYEDKLSVADVFEHLTVCAMFAKVYLSLWHWLTVKNQVSNMKKMKRVVE